MKDKIIMVVAALGILAVLATAQHLAKHACTGRVITQFGMYAACIEEGD